MPHSQETETVTLEICREDLEHLDHFAAWLDDTREAAIRDAVKVTTHLFGLVADQWLLLAIKNDQHHPLAWSE